MAAELVGKLSEKLAELWHFRSQVIQPGLRMPDFHADRCSNDHYRFAPCYPEELPETLGYHQPASPHELKVAMPAGKKPAELLEIVDLALQLPCGHLAGNPVEALGHLLLPGVSLPEAQGPRSLLRQYTLASLARQQGCEFQRNRNSMSFVECPAEFPQK